MTIETPLTAIRPEHRVALIKIARSAPADGDPAALLEATSKWWVVSDSRRGVGPASPEYAWAVSRGRVVVAYCIDGWQRAPFGARWGAVAALIDRAEREGLRLMRSPSHALENDRNPREDRRLAAQIGFGEESGARWLGDRDSTLQPAQLGKGAPC